MSTLNPFTAVQPLQSAAALLKQDQTLNAKKIVDDALSSIIKEGMLSVGQKTLINEIVQQNADNRSKARALETLSEHILSEDVKSGKMPAAGQPVLPQAIFTHCILNHLRLPEVLDLRFVSKAMKRDAIHSIRFQEEVNGRELKDFLACGGDIATLENVKVIRGEGCEELSDEDVEKISRLPKLEMIDLSSNHQITDKALRSLGANAHKLTSCDVSDTRVTNTGVAKLAKGCKALSVINLMSSGTSDGALIALGTFAKNLTSCDVSRTPVTSKGVKALAIGCQKLTAIQLGWCSNIDDRALKALSDYAHNLTSCALIKTKVTNAGVQTLAEGCKNLSVINLAGCDNIDDGALIALAANAHELISCDASVTKVTETGVEALAKDCKKLSEIHLASCENIGEQALGALGTHAHELLHCDVYNTKVTSNGVLALASGCKKLSVLNLVRCDHIDDSALMALCVYADELTRCNIAYTKITSPGKEVLARCCKKLLTIDSESVNH